MSEFVGNLFNSVTLIPTQEMSLEEQMNSIIRLLFLFFIVLLLSNFKYAIHVFCISIVIVIILYYIKKRRMNKCKENYVVRENYAPAWKNMKPSGAKIEYSIVNSTPVKGSAQVSAKTLPSYSKFATTSKTLANGQWVSDTSIVTPETIPFCNDEVSIDSVNSFAISLNQSLANGGKTPHNMIGNPVTRIRPVIVPPSLDLGYWRENNLVEHSQVNKKPQQEDLYLSGYAESSCCGYLGNGAELVPRVPVKEMQKVGGASGWNSVEGFNVRGAPPRSAASQRGIVSPVPVEDLPYVPSAPIRENFNVRGAPPRSALKQRGIISPVPVEDLPYVPSAPIRENFNNETIQNPQEIEVLTNDYYLPGAVNKTCGYNPEQIFTAGLPSNYASGTCEQDPAMKQYNENLFTSIVTPGVYQRSQITENPMSNLGISFTQQFPPMSCKRDDKGLLYTLSDPNIIEPVDHDETPLEENYEETPRYDTVFDPRFNGYGTSYRSYIDPLTGQPKFFYDDVNAIRNPNYVIRSKIDHLPYADSYGPITEKNLDGSNTPYIRALVQDSWLRDSLQFRDELTQSRMRKINAESWQKRQAPFASQPVGSTKRR